MAQNWNEFMQKAEENYKSENLDESRGGYLINLLGELESAFDMDAGFDRGKYHENRGTGLTGDQYYLDKTNHKAITKALQGLSNAMKKGYKNKLIGF